MYQWTSASPEKTAAFSEKLAAYLQPGDVITLSGDLGAGKTIFTKGLAKGLGIHDTVNSPTFTIIKEYIGGRWPLYHMDVYRIGDEEDIGIEDYYHQGGIVVIEWAENIPSWLPEEYLNISIERAGGNKRLLVFSPYGRRFESLCKELLKNERISD